MESTDTLRSATPSATLDPRRWIALAIVLAAAFMDLVDTTIVNVAAAPIRHGLGTSATTIEWVVAAYTLAFGLALVTGARLGDIFGRRRLFLVGVVSFTASSALCGAAPTGAVLIVARALQGLAAAAMVPQILSIIQVSFAPEERPKAFGAYGAVTGLASVLGPILGGLLVENDVLGLGWRSIFLVNVPIGLAALVAGARVLSESKDTRAGEVDIRGAVVLGLALLCVLYPLSEGRSLGWPAWTFILMSLAVPLLIVFVVIERRIERRGGYPLVPVALFRVPAFVGGVLAGLIFFGAVLAFFFVLLIDLQVGRHFGTLHAGLTVVPFALGATLTSGASVALAPRLGRRILIAGGVLAAAAMVALELVVRHSHGDVTTWQLAGPLLAAGLGMGLTLPPLIDLSLAGIPAGLSGAASGLLNATRLIGGAVGIAVFGTVFFDRVAASGFSDALAIPLWGLAAAFLAALPPLLLLPARGAAQPDSDDRRQPFSVDAAAEAPLGG